MDMRDVVLAAVIILGCEWADVSSLDYARAVSDLDVIGDSCGATGGACGFLVERFVWHKQSDAGRNYGVDFIGRGVYVVYGKI